MMGSVLFWLVVAVALFWALGAYNRLVRLRAQVNTAFGTVDSRMTQALALMGEAGALPPQAPSDDGPGASSGALANNHRAGLQGAAIQFEVALRVARKQPLDGAAVAALQTAFATTQPSWERWVAASTDTPAATLASIQRAWEDNVVTVRDTVTGFNDAVRAYNAAITQFPASLLAYFFGFSAAACL